MNKYKYINNCSDNLLGLLFIMFINHLFIAY